MHGQATMTTAAPLEAGTILPLVRELTETPDPMALYAALTKGGTVPGTFLLESADLSAGAGQRSVLGVGAALRIVCRGREVEIAACSPNGRALLDWVANALITAATVRREADVVWATFPAPSDGPQEESRRGALPSPLDALRVVTFGPRLLARPAESVHLAAGALSYDLIELFEELPVGRPEPTPTPHFEFVVPDRLIVIDHQRHRSIVIANAYGGAEGEANYHDAIRAVDTLVAAVAQAGAEIPDPPAGAPLVAEVEVDLSDDAYADLVRQLKQHITAGDVFQIVASRTFTLPCLDPLGSYGRLRAANPSPYLFYLCAEDSVIFGASPETAVKVDGTPRRVVIRPIAGTSARGRGADGRIDPELDARREAALRLDAKETAEHMMLVDLARNDVARASRPGTRRVTRLLSVDRYSRVMHLVSEVEGELREGLDALHAYAAAMNMGTLVGAPKLRAAQILREVETTRRGAYGGAVGYLAHDGEMDTAIVIRAAVVRNGVAAVRAGAGIVHDSEPEAEALETRRKAEAVLRAIGGVHD